MICWEVGKPDEVVINPKWTMVQPFLTELIMVDDLEEPYNTCFTNMTQDGSLNGLSYQFGVGSLGTQH